MKLKCERCEEEAEEYLLHLHLLKQEANICEECVEELRHIIECFINNGDIAIGDESEI